MYIPAAKAVFHSAVAAVSPRQLLSRYLGSDHLYLHNAGKQFRFSSKKSLSVIAAGKAAASMAAFTEDITGTQITRGICITKHQHALPLRCFETIEAGHPLPDEHGVAAASKVLEMAENLTYQDLVLVLLSGGASALLTDIVPGCTLAEIRDLNKVLIHSGATIEEINTVRKHTSRIKGGQLAKAAFPAQVITLVISDVISDDPGVIASGPTVPDPTTFEDAWQVFEKYKLLDTIPCSVRVHLERGRNGLEAETPKPGSPVFENVITEIIGSSQTALAAAAKRCAELGFRTVLLNDLLKGDTHEAARVFTEKLIQHSGKGPVCLLTGGETVLQVTGNGQGGRNQHFALCVLNELARKKEKYALPDITLLAAGTDGTDGPTDAAGAVFESTALLSETPDPSVVINHLNRFDAYTFFRQNNSLFITGPTQTNVMDIVIGITS